MSKSKIEPAKEEYITIKGEGIYHKLLSSLYNSGDLAESLRALAGKDKSMLPFHRMAEAIWKDISYCVGNLKFEI